jgi:hypothetical protein
MRFGSGILVIVSLFYTIKGIFGLLKLRKYLLVVLHMVFILGYPTLLIYMLNNFKFNWFIDIPMIVVIPLWSLYGFFINKNLENTIESNEKHFNKN